MPTVAVETAEDLSGELKPGLQRHITRIRGLAADEVEETFDATAQLVGCPRVNEAYYLRQDPGPWNSLGSLKINFPNNDAIFLHDTPTKTLFGRQERNFSSGCVRVRDVSTSSQFSVNIYGQRLSLFPFP